MKSVKVIFAALTAIILTGCTAPPVSPAVKSDSYRFTVNFEPNQPLKYRFKSSRNVTIDWGKKPGAGQGRDAVQQAKEEYELIVTYTPVEVNPFGLTTIKAECIKAEVSRGGITAREYTGRGDAADGFKGKSWTFGVSPTGQIDDKSDLLKVIREVGQGSFRPDRSRGLIKEPDMMYDFIALQWFLWDSVSSIPKPLKGVKKGELWKSKLYVPAPMILFAARDVNYTLAEVRHDPNEQIAVIDSTYSLLDPRPDGWPVPYTDTFQMSGAFGFLRDYKVLDLQGQGQELFDIKAGRVRSSSQKYTMNMLSSIPMGLGVNPKITIEQTLTMDYVPK